MLSCRGDPNEEPLALSRPSPSPFRFVPLAAAAFLATFVVCIVMVRSAPHTSFAPRSSPAPTPIRLERSVAAVEASITAGDVTATRTLPAPGFSLAVGDSLDPRVPPGPFTAQLDISFVPGATREAYVGAQIQGGQLIVRRGRDDDEVVLAEAAGDEPVQVMSAVPVVFASGRETLHFEFTARADGRRAMRALWRPLESAVPLPLPIGRDGTPVPGDAVLRGQVLAQQYKCASCHESGDAARQAMLDVDPGPVLGDVGARARPSWLRRWVREPAAVKAASSMPSLSRGLTDDEIEDLTHFLAHMGGPLAEDAAPPDPSFVATGMVAYHEIGCFACHGPLEPLDALPGSRTATARPWQIYDGLGAPGAKTTVAALAAFLRDPLASRPSGRMPDQNLSEVEATAIACYLVAHPELRGADADHGADHGDARRGDRFRVDPRRAARGQAIFARVGCANCHDLGPDRAAVASTLTAPSFESIAEVAAATTDTGCLAPDPTGDAPAYDLRADQREDLAAFLASVPARRTERVPVDRLLTTMGRLRCTACHAFRSDRGPEPAVASYFSTSGDADLGDEGRIPPDLTDAGGRLTTAWMGEVLRGDERARPYLAARMPRFAETDTTDLPGAFVATAGATSLSAAEPSFSVAASSDGRALVGVDGLNCIQCHMLGGHPSTGTPGPDLALMPGRLEFENFARWVGDPGLVRPGTRMPSFFTGGRSPLTEIAGGDARAQVAAIWSYLSQGEQLALPAGLTDPSGYDLAVGAEPIVFRTFMKDAGVRAIACGFPEGIHCAFDADRCELASVWTGRFLSAQGAWGARGGSETNPTEIAWRAPAGPTIDLAGDDGAASSRRFRGYRLDAARRPVFHYDLIRGDVVVSVSEQPLPVPSGDGGRLVRRFEIGGPPGTRLVVGGAYELVLDDAGRGSFEKEVRW